MHVGTGGNKDPVDQDNGLHTGQGHVRPVPSLGMRPWILVKAKGMSGMPNGDHRHGSCHLQQSEEPAHVIPSLWDPILPQAVWGTPFP